MFAEISALLEESQYLLWMQPTNPPFLAFENGSIFGFCCVYVDVDELLRNWERNQDDFLSRHSVDMKRIPEKAWNAYSVHLTAAQPADESRHALRDIEENFRGTRKLIGAGIDSRERIQSCLLPLLTIQNIISVDLSDPVRTGLADISSSPIIQGVAIGNIQASVGAKSLVGSQ